MKTKTITTKEKESFFKRQGVKTVFASLVCVCIGLFLGFLCLCFINFEHAPEAFSRILLNFFNYNTEELKLYYLGSTLVKAVPMILCGLSVMIAYWGGLFNIGVGGQYCIGICTTLYCALAWQLPWYLCTLISILAAALFGAFSGIFKAYRNVNEVISCIMTNWIALYLTNIVLSDEKVYWSDRSTTLPLFEAATDSLLPDGNLSKLFSDNPYVTLAPIFVILITVVISILSKRHVFGYELKATGMNRHAAKYAGMKEKKNIVLTMGLAGGLAGAAASLYFLTGIEQWKIASELPKIGFHGISVAFLGGLNPYGILVSGLFVEHITMGGTFLDTSFYSPQVADLINAIIVYFCAFVLVIRQLFEKKKPKKRWPFFEKKRQENIEKKTIEKPRSKVEQRQHRNED